jgi:hypothetical protein
MDDGHYTRGRANAYEVLTTAVEDGGIGMPPQVADDWLARWDRLAKSRDDDRERVGYWAEGLRWIRTTRGTAAQ